MNNLMFLKYPSLENHYNVSSIRVFRSHFDDVYSASEKVDGTNTCFTVNKDLEWAWQRRNGFVDSTGHYNIEEDEVNVKEYLEIAKKFFLFFDGKVKQVYLFGEWFGSGVQKVAYTNTINRKKQLLFYEVILLLADNRKYVVSREEFYNNIPEKFVLPELKRDTLKNLLNSELPTVSTLGDCLPEGLVYKPVSGRFISDTEHYLVVKHKHKEFLEKKIKEPKEKFVDDTTLVLIQSYLVERRVLNVLSHEDITLEKKNFGKIIQAVLTDAKEDILKENTNLEEKLVDKILRKSGSIVADILIKLMSEVE